MVVGYGGSPVAEGSEGYCVDSWVLECFCYSFSYFLEGAEYGVVGCWEDSLGGSWEFCEHCDEGV